jgi:hypothetical protein
VQQEPVTFELAPAALAAGFSPAGLHSKSGSFTPRIMGILGKYLLPALIPGNLEIENEVLYLELL